jgi:hypothetical protein
MGRFPAQCLAAIAAFLAFSAGCFRLANHLRGNRVD